MTEDSEPAPPVAGGEVNHLEADALRDEVVREVLEGIPVEDSTRAEIAQRMEMVIGQVNSPIPPPFMMRDYAAVVSTAPERILKMVEEQAEHRRDLEKRVVTGAERRASVGQLLALIVALAFGWFSYDLIMNDHAVAGSVIGTVDIVALASVFLAARDKQEDHAARERVETEPPKYPEAR